ncbi:hypothetical protein COO60DRAFT_688977 [Scenedesmus sp. NREL 46B-D3]|nr:hypothetical protein COO60DRAFT_688977 [Scenedesmus sp. NREL 46B-D3]
MCTIALYGLVLLHSQCCCLTAAVRLQQLWMDFSGGRRKLRGRRHGLAAPVDALGQPAYPAQHAVTEFKWASDRHDRQQDAALASKPSWTAAGALAATTLNGQSRGGSTPSTATDALAANEFKWISDYVDDADGAVDN